MLVVVFFFFGNWFFVLCGILGCIINILKRFKLYFILLVVVIYLLFY